MVPPVVMLPRFQSTHPSGVRQSFHIPLWAAASFQSTHPSGVRHWRPTGSPPRCRFQSTHPSGVRPQRPSRSWRFRRNFNPRTPVGCDSKSSPTRPHPPNFNPRTPVGCDRPHRRHRCNRSYFNPRTPVGCDGHHTRRKLPENPISIHAPQWGATYGAAPIQIFLFISIHAPQWGATIFRRCLITNHIEFQSTHPSGVRQTYDFREIMSGEFQSTHPSGVRHGRQYIRQSRKHFNPRTPVGCDHVVHARRGDDRAISIHAPQWGATPKTPPHSTTPSNFNPRTPVGCDPNRQPYEYPTRHFNPRTPVGCDLLRGVSIICAIFQSTHPSGVRPGGVCAVP